MVGRQRRDLNTTAVGQCAATDHECIDYEQLVRDATLVIDTRNATKNVTFGKDKVRTA